MSAQVDGEQNRRAFLRGVVRYLSLAGLVSMAGLLWARRRLSSPETCINLEICNGCPAFRGCDLPLALSKKKHDPLKS